jgi:lipopolysaccharide/colanic/teichoic acid biosynthesis glycosyltransferase
VLKRLSDLLLALLLLAVLAPIFAAVAILVRIHLGRPIFFRQIRTGLSGECFEVIKFRTMRDASDTHGVPLDEAFRMTSVGNMLRSLSLDELPSLWNVLKGKMSLVGPRPLLPEYLPYYSDEEFLRHQVRPGLTGWAQINGRNNLSWTERLKLDVWYVNNQSLLLDARILVRTLAVPFLRRGISQPGHPTSPRLDDERQGCV